MNPEETLRRGDVLPVPVSETAPPARARLRLEEARAFAHLLVSEIRLYHEEDVVLGRRSRDLARRLEGPISVAWERFLSRFEDRSLFEDALTRILAGGDTSRLG